jgi:hypothetical protein
MMVGHWQLEDIGCEFEHKGRQPQTVNRQPISFSVSSKSTTFAAQLIFLPKTGK